MLQVSVGTLLAFTIVAVSILILRYVPPDEVPPSPSLRESPRSNQEHDEEKGRDPLVDEICYTSQIKDLIGIEPMKDPLLEKKQYTGNVHTVELVVPFTPQIVIFSTSANQKECTFLRHDGRDEASNNSYFQHRICLCRSSGPDIFSFCHMATFVSMHIVFVANDPRL